MNAPPKLSRGPVTATRRDIDRGHVKSCKFLKIRLQPCRRTCRGGDLTQPGGRFEVSRLTIPAYAVTLMQESSTDQVDLRGVRKGQDSPLPPKYRFREFVILFSAAVLLTVPVLIYGPMPSGHDAVEHRLFVNYFSERFWSGDLYPRWLINMNHGLGECNILLVSTAPRIHRGLVNASYASAKFR